MNFKWIGIKYKCGDSIVELLLMIVILFYDCNLGRKILHYAIFLLWLCVLRFYF